MIAWYSISGPFKGEYDKRKREPSSEVGVERRGGFADISIRNLLLDHIHVSLFSVDLAERQPARLIYPIKSACPGRRQLQVPVTFLPAIAVVSGGSSKSTHDPIPRCQS